MQPLMTSQGPFPLNTKVSFFYRLFCLPNDAESYVELLGKIKSDPAAQLTSVKELWAPEKPNILYAHVLWSQTAREVPDAGYSDGTGPGG